MITHKITMDLVNTLGKYVSPIDVMQDDQYSQNIEFTLTADGKALTLTGYGVMIRFSKSDGTGGNYDRMPDDRQAYEINGNKVTIGLAPQVLTAAGKVEVSVALISGNVKLHTFSVQLNVHKNPGLEPFSTSYVSIAGTVPSDGWDPFVFLGSDANGRVVARRDVLTTDRDQNLSAQEQDEIRQKIGAASSASVEQLKAQMPKAKTYEKIAEITVEETGEGATVFSVGSNGKPFALTDFIIKVYGSFADPSAKLYMDINRSTIIANVAVANLSTTPRSFNIFFRSLEDGCKSVGISAGALSNGYYNGQMAISNSFIVPPMFNAASVINTISLYPGTGGDWTVGSTFELWGVRA